jgi:hypothetical protein
MVEVNDRLIPACNIQVEGVPGFLKMADGSEEWYGAYFEIMFEDGSLWVVEYGFEIKIPDSITIVEYPDFGKHTLGSRMKKGYSTTKTRSWDTFLILYDRKVKTI